jgi:hypothetical protein
MRARLGLAQSLWELGRREEAIEHEQELLRLNPNDNQGVRYQLLAWLLEIDVRAAVQNLLERYAEDVAASWAYGRALVNFRIYGDTRSTRALLARARRSNPFVPAYLLGRTLIPQRLPEYMGLGDDAEAVVCADEQLAAWSMTPEALVWLERAEDEARGGGGGRESVPRAMRLYYDGLVHLTDQVCATYLTDEYAQLCRRMAAALCRKRPSPVSRGWLKTWACGIAYAIGSVNFLFDRSQTPHLMAGELCALFGVSPSTGSAKATEIRRIFNLGAFDPDWCLPSKLADNPLAWMISVDGYVVDARYAPRPLQEEAVQRGLIPYLPGAPPN